MKMRPDLTFDYQLYQGVEYLVVKEPLGQKYFQFPPQVHFILTLLDGQKSIDELQELWHEKYSPKRITRQELQQLLTRFHNDGLVTSDMPGQGPELKKRGEKNRRMELFQTFSNVLAIRYRGFDPERLLNWMIKWSWWIFTKPAVIATMVLAGIALMSVIVNWDAFQAKLPGFDAFFDPKQWYLFVVVLGVTKMFHEFGHGLSCKRLGGECHEIGFMMLVLTPCLYCNVSDSWRLNNKWHRAAIGAAGMYVEVILATIATFVWWFVQPGMVQDICLRVMLVSSISTVLFNGNPLLRFDGYYILSDILEIPNMGQKSTKALTTLLGRNWLGLEIPDDALMPTNRPWAFAMYTVAAFFYRWIIMFSIILFLTTWLEPYALESVGVGLALFSLVGIVGMPGYKLYKYMSVPGRMHQVKKKRFFGFLTLGLALIACLLFVPFPHKLRCDMVVVPNSMSTVYATEEGVLQEVYVQAGDVVNVGDPIARLHSYPLEEQITRISGERDVKAIQLENARSAMTTGSFSPTDIGIYTAELNKLDADLRDLNRRKAQLTVVAGVAGTVIETPYRHPGPAVDKDELVDERPLLSEKHDNVLLSKGQRICEIADMKSWRGVVLLSDQQIKFVREGQKARLKLYSQTDEVIESTVKKWVNADRAMDREEYDLATSSLQQQDPRVQVSNVPDLINELVPQYSLHQYQYYAIVPIENPDDSLQIGLSGQARLICEYRSMKERIMWWINQTFRL